MLTPPAVIFDVDGVLVDSYRPHYESWHETAERHGVDYTEDDFLKGFGRTSREILRDQWGLTDAPDEELEEIDAAKEAAYRRIVAENFPAMAGAADLIRRLHDAGWKVAAGTSGPPENLSLCIDKLGVGPLLGAAVNGKQVARGKPAPDIFLKAAEGLGVSPNRCVVVEDSTPGVRAAKAAGMACLGYLSTGHERGELDEADRVVESFAGLTPDDFTTLLEGNDE